MASNARDGWILKETTGTTVAGSGARGFARGLPGPLVQSKKITVGSTYRASLSPTQARRITPPELVVREILGRNEVGLLAVRHPSGALTFHTASERLMTEDSGDHAPSSRVTFRVPLRRYAGADRGTTAEALNLNVLKFADRTASEGMTEPLSTLVTEWEEAMWREGHLTEGWFQVAFGGPYGLTLTPRKPKPRERALVLIHGILSNASATFGPLAGTDFPDQIRARYNDRIYAYNYYSMSRNPAENARRLLELLPAGDYVFDALTHSSGGMVLRSVVEQHRRDVNAKAAFNLGECVLAGCPNEGTPLAAPARWPHTISWLANLMEVIPINPLVSGWDFIAEALSWLAASRGVDIPGFRALDPAGQTVMDLQSSPLSGHYSALVSNYFPDAALWQRAQDAAVDDVFESACDLLMPSEGGWRIRREGGGQLSAGTVGAFGAGGNLDSGGKPVHHWNFFACQAAADFIATAIHGVDHGLRSLDTNAPLPSRRFADEGDRSGTAASLTAARGGATSRDAVVLSRPSTGIDDPDALHLLILKADSESGDDDEPPKKKPKYAQILATYRGARVLEKMRLRSDDDEPKTWFGDIIRIQRQIKDFTSHGKGDLPGEKDLMDLGRHLFNTLFVGNIRRLYDEARSRQRGTHLEIALTSTIPWIDEKPWEFCYDEVRASYLATEEIHFVRNVLSAVPADALSPGDGQLRILIASAWAANSQRLSAREEEDVIRGGFQPLVDARLASVEILPRVTPETLHRRLEKGKFDVVHFIGHGGFDEDTNEGYLVFADAHGGELILRPRSVREIFCGRGLSLVFLNSCESGAASRFVDFNLGLAQTLVAHGLPALVANQFAVPNFSATAFARYFYASLAQGSTLGEAAREARIAVNYSRHGEPIDWANPVLYTRNANLALCRPRRLDFDPYLIDDSKHGLRGLDGRRRRVGVWDVDGAFPGLERTLRRMNDSQDVYGFELIDLSMPSNIFDGSDGHRLLDPERVSKRFRNTTLLRGVELLCCVTGQTLINHVSGWLDELQKPGVATISYGGLEIPLDGSRNGRVLVNLILPLLPRFFGRIGKHEGEAKHCSLAFDAHREPQMLVERLEFDTRCLATIEKKMARDLPALKALAALFWDSA